MGCSRGGAPAATQPHNYISLQASAPQSIILWAFRPITIQHMYIPRSTVASGWRGVFSEEAGAYEHGGTCINHARTHLHFLHIVFEYSDGGGNESPRPLFFSFFVSFFEYEKNLSMGKRGHPQYFFSPRERESWKEGVGTDGIGSARFCMMEMGVFSPAPDEAT